MPASASTSSSMKALPVQERGSRTRMAWAASATISGVRARLIASSPPSRFWTAAVAMMVRGQRQLAPIPASASSAASPSVIIVMPILESV
jgi:hypothetical protein